MYSQFVFLQFDTQYRSGTYQLVGLKRFAVFQKIAYFWEESLEYGHTFKKILFDKAAAFLVVRARISKW